MFIYPAYLFEREKSVQCLMDHLSCTAEKVLVSPYQRRIHSLWPERRLDKQHTCCPRMESLVGIIQSAKGGQGLANASLTLPLPYT